MIWFICSGNGGTGKSSLAAALARTEAGNGRKVILLDASGPAHACDAYLGVPGKAVLDLRDAAQGEASVSSVLYDTPFPGLRYVMADPEDVPALAEYTECVLALQSMCGLLIVDMSSGNPGMDPEIIRGDDRAVLVLREDPLSVRAAEQSMGALQRSGAEVSLVVNQIREQDRHSLGRARETVETALGYTPDCLIPFRPDRERGDSVENVRINKAVLQAAETLCRKWRAGG